MATFFRGKLLGGVLFETIDSEFGSTKNPEWNHFKAAKYIQIYPMLINHLVSIIFYFHPNLGKWSILTSIFFRWGWNLQRPSSTPLARRMRWSRTWNFAEKQRLRCPHSENGNRLHLEKNWIPTNLFFGGEILDLDEIPTSILGWILKVQVLANDVVCVCVFFFFRSLFVGILSRCSNLRGKGRALALARRLFCMFCCPGEFCIATDVSAAEEEAQ